MLKFNTGNFQIHTQTKNPSLRDTLHLIAGEIDAALCEIRFARKFFIQYHTSHRIIPKYEYVTVDEALRSPQKYCKQCILKLTSITRNHRISAFTSFLQSHSGIPKNILENKSAWTETTCSNCGTSVGFWNKQKKQEHFCTVCKKPVKLPKEVVA